MISEKKRRNKNDLHFGEKVTKADVEKMSPEELREMKRRYKAEQTAAYGNAKIEFTGNTFTEAEKQELVRLKKAGDADAIKRIFESKGIHFKKKNKVIKDEYQKVKNHKLRQLKEKKEKPHKESEHSNDNDN